MKRPIIAVAILAAGLALVALASRRRLPDGTEANPFQFALYPGDVQGQLAVAVFDGEIVSPWVDAETLVDAMKANAANAPRGFFVLYTKNSPSGTQTTAFKQALESLGHTVITEAFAAVPPRPARGPDIF